MVCKNCGQALATGAKFCPSCGSTVEQNNNVDLGKTIQVDVNSIQNMNNNANNNKKSNNKLYMIIGGIVLALVAAIVVIFALKGSSNDIEILEKAINNLYNEEVDNLTLTGKIEMGSEDMDFEFSADLKVAQLDDEYKLMLRVNKSMLFDEMSLYSHIKDKKMKLYTTSDVVDLLGMTESENKQWLYYEVDADEVLEDIKEEEKEKVNVDLGEILDKEHFAFVEETNGVRKYKLTIDKKLVDDLIKLAEEKLSKEELEELNDSIETLESLEHPLNLEIYINKQNKFTKVVMDLANFIEEEETLTKLKLTFELTNVNATTVEIPQEALNSTTDLTTYAILNPKTDEYDSSYDYDYSTDYDTDLDW